MIALSLAASLLLPANAPAESLLPPPKLPNAGETIGAAQDTVNSVTDDLGSALPPTPVDDVLDPAPNPTPGPVPEPVPTPDPPPPPNDGPSGSATPLSDTPSAEPSPSSGSVPSQQASQSSPRNDGKGAKPKGGAGDGARDGKVAATSGALVDPPTEVDFETTANKGKDGPGTTVLERFINVIPAGIKIALGVLAGLFLIAAAMAIRTRRQLAAARRRAVTDGLTGVPNRRHVDEVIERLLADSRRTKRPLSAILFDLDRFKAINDNYGHAVGDRVLRATADAVRELLRGGDHVARFGGEEFIVLLPETSGADALLVADKMRLTIAALEIEDLEGGFFTASFGVAAYPDDGSSSDELFSAADEALYRAKEGGRNRVERPSAPLASRELSLA